MDTAERKLTAVREADELPAESGNSVGLVEGIGE
jgi:hypothetical protein